MNGWMIKMLGFLVHFWGFYNIRMPASVSMSQGAAGFLINFKTFSGLNLKHQVTKNSPKTVRYEAGWRLWSSGLDVLADSSSSSRPFQLRLWPILVFFFAEQHRRRANFDDPCNLRSQPNSEPGFSRHGGPHLHCSPPQRQGRSRGHRAARWEGTTSAMSRLSLHTLVACRHPT